MKANTTRQIIVLNEERLELPAADNAKRLNEFWKTIIAEQPDHESEKESLCVILMNARLHPYAWHRVSLGTVDECSAHPREIFRPVIVGGASGFALMHNHPSGDPSPSRGDEHVTRRIVEVSEIMGIRFLDHVIMGKPSPGRCSYFSFREAGLIP